MGTVHALLRRQTSSLQGTKWLVVNPMEYLLRQVASNLSQPSKNLKHCLSPLMRKEASFVRAYILKGCHACCLQARPALNETPLFYAHVLTLCCACRLQARLALNERMQGMLDLMQLWLGSWGLALLQPGGTGSPAGAEGLTGGDQLPDSLQHLALQFAQHTQQGAQHTQRVLPQVLQLLLVAGVSGALGESQLQAAAQQLLASCPQRLPGSCLSDTSQPSTEVAPPADHFAAVQGLLAAVRQLAVQAGVVSDGPGCVIAHGAVVGGLTTQPVEVSRRAAVQLLPKPEQASPASAVEAPVVRRKGSRLKALAVVPATVPTTPPQPPADNIAQTTEEGDMDVAAPARASRAGGRKAAALPAPSRKPLLGTVVSCQLPHGPVDSTPKPTPTDVPASTGPMQARQTANQPMQPMSGSMARPPLLLVLSPDLQPLPWESMHSLLGSGAHDVYRMPSLLLAATLAAQQQSFRQGDGCMGPHGAAPASLSAAAPAMSDSAAGTGGEVVVPRGRCKGVKRGVAATQPAEASAPALLPASLPYPFTLSSTVSSPAGCVDLHSTFYLLNPGGDLPDTQVQLIFLVQFLFQQFGLVVSFVRPLWF